MPEVSVVVASYNYDKYIGKTLAGILGQTLGDLELIVVDDGSRDNSVNVIQEYAKRDRRVRLIMHEANCGIARTFNDGLEAACGRFAAISGCDDVWMPNKLDKQLAVLRDNEDLVVHSDAVTIDGEGKPIPSRPSRRSAADKSGRIFKALLEGNFVLGSSMIFKLANLGDIRFDAKYRYVNDYKFVLDLARRYEYFFVPEPLVQYRIHGGNVTLRDKGGWLRDFAMFGGYLLEAYPDAFTRKARARFLFKMALDAMARGDTATGRRYLLKAAVNRPFRMQPWAKLLSSFAAVPKSSGPAPCE